MALAGPTQDARRRYGLWLIVLLAAGWLLVPIIHPTHVEGFSASIVSLALHLNQGHLADFDRLHPANLEYFAHSRLGTVALESVLSGPLRLGGDLALRLITWSGFVALVISSFLLVRRWTQSPALLVVVLLLLLPGVAESAFFYNDTIFAAALGVSALAMVTVSESTLATIGGGLFLGAAIVARLDAVLLAPAVVLVGYEQNGLQGRFWWRAAVFAAGVAIPVILIPAALQTSILHVFEVTSNAVRLWGEPVKLRLHARELSIFVGMPVMILAALGAYSLWVRRERARLLLLVGMPVFFNLAAFGKIWQSRQLLPMTPFIVALAAFGWQHVAATSVSDRGRLRAIVVAIGAFVLLAPPFVVRMSDGPRAPYGRLWSPLLWMRWQSHVRADFATIRELAANRPQGTTVVITDTWNSDRYLHLALQEAGYTVSASAAGDSSCRRVSETFLDGARRVVHIRLHQPFLGEWRALAAGRLEGWGVPCIASLGVGNYVLLTPAGRSARVLGDAHASIVVTTGPAPGWSSMEYDPQSVTTASVASLDDLQQGLLTDATRDGSIAVLDDGVVTALLVADSLMKPIVWTNHKSAP